MLNNKTTLTIRRTAVPREALSEFQQTLQRCQQWCLILTTEKQHKVSKLRTAGTPHRFNAGCRNFNCDVSWANMNQWRLLPFHSVLHPTLNQSVWTGRGRIVCSFSFAYALKFPVFAVALAASCLACSKDLKPIAI